MSYTGYKRSLSVSITKLINGSPDTGYPKTYPTATDISNGYFTYNSTQYTIPSDVELAEMDQATYDDLVANFKLYVGELEDIDFDTDFSNTNQIEDLVTCSNTTTSTTTTAAVDLTSNMVAAWNFNESSGTTVNDIHTATYNGLNTGGITLAQTGKLGNCYLFSAGTPNGEVEVAYNANLVLSEFTYVIWINPVTFSPNRFLRPAGGSGYISGCALMMSSGSEFRVEYGDGTTHQGSFQSGETLTAGQWYLVGLSYKDSTFKLYVNGVLKHTESDVTFGYHPTTPQNYKLEFGNSSIDAYIDDTFMYARELSDAEHAALWNSGNGLTYAEL